MHHSLGSENNKGPDTRATGRDPDNPIVVVAEVAVVADVIVNR